VQGNQFELGDTRLQDLNWAIQLQPQFAMAPYNRALAYYAGGGRRWVRAAPWTWGSTVRPCGRPSKHLEGLLCDTMLGA